MNLCRACGEDFGSIHTFDDHRVGTHEYLWSPEREDGRRCLDVDEMRALGWTKNQFGRWTTPERLGRGRLLHERAAMRDRVESSAPRSRPNEQETGPGRRG